MNQSPSTSPVASGATTPTAEEDVFHSTHSVKANPDTQRRLSSVEHNLKHLDLQPKEETHKSESKPHEVLARLLEQKAQEWTAVVEMKERKGPLQLLDLPIDVLKEIIHQLPHTNDLISLALCHSALHSLATPSIYSRFDIVWPEPPPNNESRSGVDALTYGLATLVMAQEIYNEAPNQQANAKTGRDLSWRRSKRTPTRYPLKKRRRGNNYAQYTKKFSLGNGPVDWVQEYLITKECGKMLGTLVALAVARMRNLETFVWDMPTGILRDVWLSLSSLADDEEEQDCRLERLWVRWHDNSQIDPPPADLPPPPNAAHPSGAPAPPITTTLPTPPAPIAYMPAAIERVENPTFSVIPPLKSLSVLDIDELPYLDEMSILIARSQRKLRELRVGIARHAMTRDWVTAWDGDHVQQVDYSTPLTAESSIGEKRLGGVLGILVGRVYNLKADHDPAVPEPEGDVTALDGANTKADVSTVETTAATVGGADEEESIAEDAHQHAMTPSDAEAAQVDATLDAVEEEMSSSQTVEDMSAVPAAMASGALQPAPEPPATSITKRKSVQINTPPAIAFDEDQPPNEVLKLETLELERTPISVSAMLKALDWSILSTLTLLHCTNHEHLWRALRRKYSPRILAEPSTPGKSIRQPSYSRSDYSLNLKKIHTNSVSPALITFLKETLAPNSLEVLFLQEGRSYSSSVTIDAIYKGPLRRHRGSLKKLLIDSSEKSHDGQAVNSARWRRWMLSREILNFVTSGRMSALRELAVNINYSDWHNCFLQRLPNIPHLRSLYIPHVADHPHNNVDPQELALQVVDIVALRPDIEICYMGIANKCFEILENKPYNYEMLRSDGTPLSHHPNVTYDEPIILSEDDDDEDEEDEDEEDADVDPAVVGTPAAEGEETESDGDEDDVDGDETDVDDSSWHEDERKQPKLRLREILFYDDKVAIFKARHGRL